MPARRPGPGPRPPVSACCRALDAQFDRKRVERKVRAYREDGPEPTTRALIEALRREGASGSLLDIGGGLGAIPAALLEGGVTSAVLVEAAPAYLEASRELAEEGGYADRLQGRLGDFVELAPEIGPADIVTLDAAICCYPEMEPLLDLSAARARSLYGMVVPRTRWSVRSGLALENLGRRLVGNPFRIYAHPLDRMEAIVRRHGLDPRSRSRTFAWEVRVYGR